MASLLLILGMVGLVAAAAVAVLSHLARPKVLEVLGRLPVEQRANLLLLWALLPLFVALLAVTAVVAPSILAAAGLMADHCLPHGSHHSHLCLLHPGHTPTLPGAELMLGLMLAGLVMGGGVKARQLLRRDRRWRTLRRLAQGNTDAGIRILRSARPVAATVGWLRPAVFLSRGLLQNLSPGQRQVVVAHETAHRLRGDPLRLALARLGGRFHVPASGRALCRELDLAVERAADEAAARRVGDRVTVAEALVAVARLRPVAVPGPGFAQDPLEVRVEALLGGAEALRRPRRSVAIALLALPLTLLVFSPQVHHGLESLLGHL